MARIGIVITDPRTFLTADPLLDSAPLCAALSRLGAEAEQVIWHDPEVDWSAFDLVVLRSLWDYPERAAEFEAWLDRVGAVTRILNEPALVRWNMDKRYLAQLEEVGIPGIPTSYHRDPRSLAAALAAWSGSGAGVDSGSAGGVGSSAAGGVGSSAAGSAGSSAAGGAGADSGSGHVVLKPTVGAGSRQAALLPANDPAALELGRQILADGGVVMVQPEVPELSAGREKALYAVDGRFTHAISKGALLARGGGLRGGRYQETPQVVEAGAAERAFAERVLAATTEVTGLEMPLYARIDTVESAEHGLVLLEAELFEPLFNLHLVPAVTETFATAILARA